MEREMMDGIYQSWQNGVMWACLGMLGVMAVGIILYGFGLAWGKVREWWSLPFIERVLAGVFVVGFAYYGSTKHGAPSVRWDDGLADNGTLITNDMVSVRWTYSGIPSASSVFIDYREAGTTNDWLNLAETLASALSWTGTLANATNYDYWVYSTYVPPVPVHTNGVWVGQAYETKARVGAKSFLILNGMVQEHGRTIATPAAKRRDLVRYYIQSGLIAIWDGIENAGFGVHDASATVWKDLIGGYDATRVNAKWGDKYAQFDGVGNDVAKTGSLLGKPSNATLEVVYSRGNQGNGCMAGCTQSGGFSLWYNNDTQIDYWARGYGYPLRLSANDRNDGLIHSRSTTMGSIEIAYYDAVQIGTYGGSAIVYNNNCGFNIGADSSGTQYGIEHPFIGKIYCVRIYSRALSADEIRHNYEIDKERFNLP